MQDSATHLLLLTTFTSLMTFYLINLKYILKQSNIYFVMGQNKYFFVFYNIVE